MFRRVFDHQIAVHHVQNVEMLAFVLVDPLDLHVVKRVEWNLDASCFSNILLELHLVLALDIEEALNEITVFGPIAKLGKCI